MSLTTKDILEKTFKRSFKGYDEDEVDKFLDQIIDEVKILQSENSSLKKEINTVRELETSIKGTEDTIMSTLVSAQKSSERILREAARKAELLIDNAENTAKQKTEQTTLDLADMERKLQILKQSASNYATSFSEMVTSQTSAFEKTYQSFFGDMDVYSSGGINMDALEKIDQDISQDINEIVKLETEAEPSEPGSLAIEQEPPPEQQEIAVEWNIPQSEELKEPLMDDTLRSEPEDLEPVSLKPVEEEIKPVDAIPLNEINKALNEIEEGDDDLSNGFGTASGKDDADASGKTKLDDYSWLYGDDEKTEKSDFELSFKDPKEKEELKSLIDDVID